MLYICERNRRRRREVVAGGLMLVFLAVARLWKGRREEGKKGANQCFWIAAANTFALRWTQRENDRTKTAYVCRSPFLVAPQHRSFPGRENTHVADSTISIFIIYYLGDYKCTHIIICIILRCIQ